MVLGRGLPGEHHLCRPILSCWDCTPKTVVRGKVYGRRTRSWGGGADDEDGGVGGGEEGEAGKGGGEVGARAGGRGR